MAAFLPRAPQRLGVCQRETLSPAIALHVAQIGKAFWVPHGTLDKPPSGNSRMLAPYKAYLDLKGT